MPCYDSRGSGAEELNRECNKKINKLEAMLCGIFNVLLTQVDAVDILQERWNEKECGVSFREVHNWWARHSKKDAERKSLSLSQRLR